MLNIHFAGYSDIEIAKKDFLHKIPSVLLYKKLNFKNQELTKKFRDFCCII